MGLTLCAQRRQVCQIPWQSPQGWLGKWCCRKTVVFVHCLYSVGSDAFVVRMFYLVVDVF